MRSTLVRNADIITILPVLARWALRRTRVSSFCKVASLPLTKSWCEVIIAAVSTFFFTILVLLSSFVTTWFIVDDDDSYSFSVYYPYEVFRNLIKMTIGILADDGMISVTVVRQRTRTYQVKQPQGPPSLLGRFIRRFLLGLPVVGAGSIAHMLLSIPLPFHWLRFRTRRTGRQSKDLMALIVLAVVLAGAAR